MVCTTPQFWPRELKTDVLTHFEDAATARATMMCPWWLDDLWTQLQRAISLGKRMYGHTLHLRHQWTGSEE
jgi:hypothetical protein